MPLIPQAALVLLISTSIYFLGSWRPKIAFIKIIVGRQSAIAGGLRVNLHGSAKIRLLHAAPSASRPRSRLTSRRPQEEDRRRRGRPRRFRRRGCADVRRHAPLPNHLLQLHPAGQRRAGRQRANGQVEIGPAGRGRLVVELLLSIQPLPANHPLLLLSDGSSFQAPPGRRRPLGPGSDMSDGRVLR